MRAGDIADMVREIAPESLSERLVKERGYYDNTGLVLCPAEREVERVLVCLDCGQEEAEEALALDCQMILSHHPLLYHPIRSLRLPGERLYIELVRAGIAVYSAHLSLDAAKGGVNESLALALGLETPRPLLDLGAGAGLNFCGTCREPFPALLDRVRTVTGGSMRVSRAPEPSPPYLVCAANGGAGDVETMELARAAGCRVLISGDARHHAFVWARDNGFVLVDAGHFETEHFFMKILTRRLNERAGGEVMFYMSGSSAPYVTL